jgi:hypothetical protein
VITDAVKHRVSHFKESSSGTKPKGTYSIKGHCASGQEKLDGSVNFGFLKKYFLIYAKEKVAY